MSRSAVSYALRDDPSISPSVRQRVQRIARELGWEPDHTVGRQMALIRTTLNRTELPSLGIITLRESRTDFDDVPVLRDHLEGVRGRAGELGFAVQHYDLNRSWLTAAQLAGELQARRIRGLLYVDFDLSVPLEYWNLGGAIPAVSVGVDPRHTRVHLALADYLEMGRTAVAELARLGYRRIGVVLPAGVERLLHWTLTGGWAAGFAAHPALPLLPFLYPGGAGFTIGADDHAAVWEWLDVARPEVVLGLDIPGLRRCLGRRARFRRLPVYTLDWPVEGACGGIDQRAVDIGRAAVDLLVSQMERTAAGIPQVPTSVLVQPRWVAPKRR